MRSIPLSFLAVLVLASACAQGTDVGRYTGGATTGGGAGQGGASGAAGATVGGSAGQSGAGASAGGWSGSGGSGFGGSAGAPPGGSAGAANGCASGEKSCGGVCVPPMPGIGCTLADCTPCPGAPPNSVAVCTSGVCDFSCNPDYVRNGNFCQAVSGSGGSGGGGGGTGGAPATPPPNCATGLPCASGQPVDAMCITVCAIQSKVGICLGGCCACL